VLPVASSPKGLTDKAPDPSPLASGQDGVEEQLVCRVSLGPVNGIEAIGDDSALTIA